MARIIFTDEETQVVKESLDEIKKLLVHKAPETDDPILTTEQVMSMLGVCRRTVQKWRDEGKIRFSEIDKKIYYRQSAIDEMLSKHEVKKRDTVQDKNIKKKQ